MGGGDPSRDVLGRGGEPNRDLLGGALQDVLVGTDCEGKDGGLFSCLFLCDNSVGCSSEWLGRVGGRCAACLRGKDVG